MENMLNVILPYIVTVIGGWLTAYTITFIKAKIGIANYKKMKDVAWDVWKAVDEDTRLGDLIGTKFEAFEKMIRIKFPKITDADIKLLNKSIANEYNKDKPKVEKAIEDTTTTETPTDTNTPSTTVSEPTAPNTTNEDILNQIKDLVSKIQ